MIKHSPILSAVWSPVATLSDKFAPVWNDESGSYSQMRKKIEVAAQYLRSRGVGASDRLGIVAKKGLDFVYRYLAGQLIGAVNVVLDPEANEKRLEYIKEMTNSLTLDLAAEIVFT